MSEDYIVGDETAEERARRREVYALGVRARREGEPISNNPFRETNKLHYNWRKGWEGGL